MHSRFLKAVNILGVDVAVPKKILEIMQVRWVCHPARQVATGNDQCVRSWQADADAGSIYSKWEHFSHEPRLRWRTLVVCGGGAERWVCRSSVKV
eukprot:60811-Chlamydomonas_euryale.AAC.10